MVSMRVRLSFQWKVAGGELEAYVERIKSLKTIEDSKYPRACYQCPGQHCLLLSRFLLGSLLDSRQIGHMGAAQQHPGL